MSDYNLTGTIEIIGAVQEFDSGFKKRQFVIKTSGEYPQDIVMQFFRDKCDILKKYKVGDKVTVWFNLAGSEWDGKYFVNLNAWRIAMTSESNFEGIKQSSPDQMNGEMAEDFNDGQRRLMNEQQDDLPF